MEESHPRSRHLLASALRLSLTRPEESRFHVGSLLNEGEGEKEPARGWRISFGDSNSFLRLITYHYGWRENDRPRQEVLQQLDTIARLSMRSSNSDFISFLTLCSILHLLVSLSSFALKKPRENSSVF